MESRARPARQNSAWPDRRGRDHHAASPRRRAFDAAPFHAPRSRTIARTRTLRTERSVGDWRRRKIRDRLAGLRLVNSVGTTEMSRSLLPRLDRRERRTGAARNRRIGILADRLQKRNA